jgi:hypothetical protein
MLTKIFQIDHLSSEICFTYKAAFTVINLKIKIKRNYLIVEDCFQLENHFTKTVTIDRIGELAL